MDEDRENTKNRAIPISDVTAALYANQKERAFDTLSEALGFLRSPMVACGSLPQRMESARCFFRAHVAVAASSTSLLTEALALYEHDKDDLDEDRTEELLTLFVRAARLALGQEPGENHDRT